MGAVTLTQAQINEMRTSSVVDRLQLFSLLSVAESGEEPDETLVAGLQRAIQTLRGKANVNLPHAEVIIRDALKHLTPQKKVVKQAAKTTT